MKLCKECSANSNNNMYCDKCAAHMSVNTIKEVLMKNTTLKEARALARKNQEVISAWYADNKGALDPIVEGEEISFETAEELRHLLYFTESLRKTRKSSSSVKLSDEVVSYSETVYLEDALQENDEDEDFIWDLGGNETSVEKQYKAAILTGDYSKITKRSSVYEEGGGSNLVRATDVLHGNHNIFVAAGSEKDLHYKEDRMVEGYIEQMALRYNNRRNGYVDVNGNEVAGELEMRDYAKERYAYYASLIITNEDVVKYAETADDTTALVRADLKAKFGKEYIYMACKYTHKGKRYGSFDQCFHDHMYKDIILPVKNQLKVDERRDTYLEILELVDSIPASSPRHLAWLILNKHQEFGIPVKKVAQALGYAWDNKDKTQFTPAVYFALKQIAA